MAAWYAYRVMRLIGIARFWILVVVALLLMTVRRLTALAIEAGAVPALTAWVASLDRLVLPLVISVCLLLGMYELFYRLRQKIKG